MAVIIQSHGERLHLLLTTILTLIGKQFDWTTCLSLLKKQTPRTYLGVTTPYIDIQSIK